LLLEKAYFSVGWGFIVEENESISALSNPVTPYSCHSAATLLDNCRILRLRVSGLVRFNETTWRTAVAIETQAFFDKHNRIKNYEFYSNSR
jgi:hypothetical protein